MEFIKAKTIVSNYVPNNSWFGLNYNMNIYKGCCHGCIYCDSRSDCYEIENFDIVRAKENSTEIIEGDLRSKRKKGVIGIGAMSDPYNPFEKKYELTRKALEVVDRYNFGISIATKSPLITRDIDILKRISNHSPVLIKITITTADDDLCRIIEPHVQPSSKRFKAIKELTDSGIFTGILLMPILPFINDSSENVKAIVKGAYEAGAKFIFAYGMGVTLRSNQRDYYYERIRDAFTRKNLVGIYRRTYGDRYECSSPKGKELWNLFKMECERYGILYKMEDIIEAYRKNYEHKQISFL